MEVETNAKLIGYIRELHEVIVVFREHLSPPVTEVK